MTNSSLHFHLIPFFTGTNSNGTAIVPNSSHSVSNNLGSTVQPPINHQHVAQSHPPTAPPVLTVPSHLSNNNNTSAVSNAQQTVAPTQNSIYLSIACGDEQTRHRFCLVVQMMCSLLQKNGQSADAINQFTERFKYLKEQADLSAQNEETFLKALCNFGNFTEVQPYNPSMNAQSGNANHNNVRNGLFSGKVA